MPTSLKEIFNPYEILKELGLIAVFEGTIGTVKKWLEKNGEKMGEAVYKKLMDEHRVEFLAWLVTFAGRYPNAAANIRRRLLLREQRMPKTYVPSPGQSPRYKAGSENALMGLLVKIFMGLSEVHEAHKRTEVFRHLGNLSDREFDTEIEFVHHDVVRQFYLRMKEEFGDLWTSIAPKLEEWDVKTARELRDWHRNYRISTPVRWLGYLLCGYGLFCITELFVPSGATQVEWIVFKVLFFTILGFVLITLKVGILLRLVPKKEDTFDGELEAAEVRLGHRLPPPPRP